jgi:hypothetical protein
VLSLLPACSRLILYKAPEFGLPTNQVSHAYIPLYQASFSSLSKSMKEDNHPDQVAHAEEISSPSP